MKRTVTNYKGKQKTTEILKEVNEFLQITQRINGEGFVVTHTATGNTVCSFYFPTAEAAEEFAGKLLTQGWDWSKSTKEEIVGGVENLVKFNSTLIKFVKDIPHASEI